MATYVVKRGDNLTHIARRFGVGHWRVLYNHPKNAEFKRKRPNPNLIYPGDVLYIPGQDVKPQVIDLGETTIVGTIPGKENELVQNLSEEERKKLLGEAKEVLPEDWKPYADGALTVISWGITVAQLVELANLIGSVGASAMLTPLALAIRSSMAWVSAWEVNEKMYGFRGSAYSTTAWAFGRPRPPGESPEMMKRFREFSPDSVIRDRQQAWREFSQKQWHYWETAYKRERVSKAAMQNAIKLEGIALAKHYSGGPEQKLCLVLLQSFEPEFRKGINRDSWRDGYSVLYPR